MLSHRMDTANLSESDVIEKKIQDKWEMVFTRYVSKGDSICLTFWDDFTKTTPRLDVLGNFAVENTVNSFNQNVMKLPATNEVRDIIIDGAFTFSQVLISYFHLDIRTSENRRIFSSEDNGTVVLLDISEDDHFFLNKNSIAESLSRLEKPTD